MYQRPQRPPDECQDWQLAPKGKLMPKVNLAGCMMPCLAQVSKIGSRTRLPRYLGARVSEIYDVDDCNCAREHNCAYLEVRSVD